ncbi:unnamed protein product [Nippostrongylus brasiliensis]|uniref:ShKT domain-containing protein n=1 Tax=Nippostrongylus brasiliensis TaxID=27835 RepID=A0A0N4XWP6_NIPBR|nr:hypothetical protein Q1695_013190 [Nippostrongylus brasiliensis]VDL70926.1 unnamed protein product [Nippostrongylus brasiliensis]
MFWSVFCVLLLVNVLVSNVEAQCVDKGGAEYCKKFEQEGGCKSGETSKFIIAATKCAHTCVYCKRL